MTTQTTTSAIPAPAANPGPMVLAVRDWDKHFEIQRGRRRQGDLPWVALPTRHDGKRFGRLTLMERGIEIYAAWCLILTIAAKCPRRGILADDRGEALTAEDLAVKTGFPVEVFEMAVAALLDERIGWLQRIPLPQVEQEPQPARPAAGGTPVGGTPVGGTPISRLALPPQIPAAPAAEIAAKAVVAEPAPKDVVERANREIGVPNGAPDGAPSETRRILEALGIDRETAIELSSRPTITPEVIKQTFYKITDPDPRPTLIQCLRRRAG